MRYLHRRQKWCIVLSYIVSKYQFSNWRPARDNLNLLFLRVQHEYFSTFYIAVVLHSSFGLLSCPIPTSPLLLKPPEIRNMSPGSFAFALGQLPTDYLTSELPPSDHFSRSERIGHCGIIGVDTHRCGYFLARINSRNEFLVCCWVRAAVTRVAARQRYAKKSGIEISLKMREPMSGEINTRRRYKIYWK